MIVAVLKPKGPTSHDIIDEIRLITGEQKVGHAGTLDPLASGVLVVGIGREATKKLNEIVQKEKEYIASVRLGVTSTTDDEEGLKHEVEVKEIPEDKKISLSVRRFVGSINQTPPVYSAVKVGGQESYKRARRGEEVKLRPRAVEIKEIEILEYKWPILKLRVVTGPGVYIRSLARDIGASLGVGGYLAKLERTRVGEFTKEKAISMENLKINLSKTRF